MEALGGSWKEFTMDLGAFSISLTVSDLAASKAFYEKLGFAATGGAEDEGWLIMVNQPAVIGLFSGMFDKNILTFNPGLVLGTEQPETFTDVREIQEKLEAAGLELQDRVDPDSAEGPGHLTLLDPDGNPILIDQHR
jgi:catechol 2,3-dioxygenase-like lactoylglutathione lyase family enzyme